MVLSHNCINMILNVQDSNVGRYNTLEIVISLMYLSLDKKGVI